MTLLFCWFLEWTSPTTDMSIIILPWHFLTHWMLILFSLSENVLLEICGVFLTVESNLLTLFYPWFSASFETVECSLFFWQILLPWLPQSPHAPVCHLLIWLTCLISFMKCIIFSNFFHTICMAKLGFCTYLHFALAMLAMLIVSSVSFRKMVFLLHYLL